MEETQAAAARCGEEAQPARCCCGIGEGESSGRTGKVEHRASVEKAGASHPINVGCGSEASSSDASAKNRDSKRGTQIRVDETEQSWTSGQALVLPYQNPTPRRSFNVLSDTVLPSSDFLSRG
jgi:hypothetical protein